MKAFLFVVLSGLHTYQQNYFSLYSSNIYKAKEIIGKRIKFLREQRNLSQQDLADLLNVDRQYIWKLETGKKNLTLDYLDKIIFKLNCKHEDFLNIISNY